MEKTYELIHDLCKTRATSIPKMCKEIGLSRSLFAELKSGRTKRLSTQTLESVSSYLGVPVTYFLNPGEPDPRDIPPEPELTDDQLLVAFWGKNPHNMTTEDVKRLKDLAKIMEMDRAKSSNSEKGGQH